MLEPQTECTCTCSQSAMLEPQTDSKKHSSCSQSAMLEPQTDCKKTLLCRKRLGHRHHVMCSTILEPQTEKPLTLQRMLGHCAEDVKRTQQTRNIKIEKPGQCKKGEWALYQPIHQLATETKPNRMNHNMQKCYHAKRKPKEHTRTHTHTQENQGHKKARKGTTLILSQCLPLIK